jgi:hypothetical protein
MKRAGGWLLGLLIIASLAGGGWFALRRVFIRETVSVFLLQTDESRDPTTQALNRGILAALQECGERAGKYRVQYIAFKPEDAWNAAVWIGTSESLLLKGDNPVFPLFISAFDTHPWDPSNCFRVTPGCERQGLAAAIWAKKSGAARVFLLREAGSRRSEAIAAAFFKAARDRGITVLNELYTSPAQTLSDLVLAAKPDLVFYTGEEAPYGSAYRHFSALRASGFVGPFLMGDADPEVSFLATRPDLVDGTYLVSPFAPAPPELAQAMGVTPGPHVTAGYFAMKAALEAIDRANSIDPEELRRAAATLPYFDAQGKAALRKCALYRVRDNTFEFVELLD